MNSPPSHSSPRPARRLRIELDPQELMLLRRAARIHGVDPDQWCRDMLISVARRYDRDELLAARDWRHQPD